MSEYGNEKEKTNPEDETTDAGNGGAKSTDADQKSDRDDTKQQ